VILVDTSVWVDHLRAGNATLADLLEGGSVLIHPSVIGELALGNLRRRGDVLPLLHALPQAVVATDAELLSLIDDEALYGSGIGYVDAQLLAATRLTPGIKLWTEERRLASMARRLGIGYTATPN